MRSHTEALHRRAERSGVLHRLLGGTASRRDYALLLRNLQPVYAAMERGLDRHLHSPAIGALAERDIYRAPALEADLAALWGPDWRDALPVLPVARRYADRVEAAADGGGTRLIAHAYVRFLGDLNGGRILNRLVGRSLALGPEALSFYAYAGIDDIDVFRSAYRSAIDRAGAAIGDAEAVIEEAGCAFSLNIDLSEAVCEAAWA